MKTVTLKNGMVEPEPAVLTTMMMLRDTAQKDPMVFYDFVMKCRDHGYEFFGQNETRLKSRGLLGVDGRIHDTVKNITLSAVSGEGMGMSIGNPEKV